MDTMMDVTDYLCIDFIIFNDFFFIFISYCFTDFCFKIIHDRLHFIIHYSFDFFFSDIIIDQVISSL